MLWAALDMTREFKGTPGTLAISSLFCPLRMNRLCLTVTFTKHLKFKGFVFQVSFR